MSCASESDVELEFVLLADDVELLLDNSQAFDESSIIRISR